MDFKNFFKKYGIHFVAIVVFMIVGMIYFSPQFGEYGIKQHDIKQYKGMSNEALQYREITGDEPMWTNSMFGGMPATQISLIHSGNIVKAATNWFIKLFPIPFGAFFLHLICFYIFAMFLRIKPIIAILGAFAFAFASYEIIILQAGHNTKSIAVAFMPAVLGAFIYAFRKNWKIGTAFSALFMAFEVSANHLQVTYYLGFLLLGLGIYFFVEAIRKKQIKKFAFSTVGVIAGYLIAFLINYGNISTTNDYAKYTTRGGNDITINADGSQSKVNTSGLDKEYITQWSYGIGESFTFVSPYVKGSHSYPLVMTEFAEVADNLDLSRSEYEGAKGMSLYWGDQSMVAGPFYLGVIVIFLGFLALFFVKDRSIWVIVGVSFLALLLSWGKNFMGLTDFFIDNIPGYNKFRTVTIILVLIELCVPVLAVLLLQKLWDEREKIAEQKKLFLVASGLFVVFLLGLKFAGGNNFGGPADDRAIAREKGRMMQQIMSMDPNTAAQQYRLDIRNEAQVAEFVEQNMGPVYDGVDGIKKVRKAMYDSSTTRSLLFGLVTIGLTALFFYTALPSFAIVGGLGLLLLIDLVPVNRNYLGEGEDLKGNLLHWSEKAEKDFPLAPNGADHMIMAAELEQDSKLQKAIDEGEKRGKAKADEFGYTGNYKRRIIDSYRFQALGLNTNYRVADLSGGWGGTWNDSKASYFHKSIGGYHGAKLRNIQNLFEFQIGTIRNPMESQVLNMLNVKYIIQGESARENVGAMGNGWAIKKVKTYDTANDEIRALGRKYKVTNVGDGQLFVNGDVVTELSAYGLEKMIYLPKQGDSIDIVVSDRIKVGTSAYWATDSRGTANLLPGFTFENDTTNSFSKLVEVKAVEEFDATEEVVMLKTEASKLSAKEYTGDASVYMTSYDPKLMKYDVKAKGKQLIVFSEIYYPNGWTATVDGKETDILKVNYLLRGIEVEGGDHKVELKFDNAKYHGAKKFAYGGSTLLLLLIAGVLFLEFRSRKTVEVKETKED